MSELVRIITASDSELRDQSLDAYCRVASLADLLNECQAVDQLRRENDNLYQRVRALFFLYAIHRFHLPLKMREGSGGRVPYEGYRHLLARRFEESIDHFLDAWRGGGRSCSVLTALFVFHTTRYRSLSMGTRTDWVAA